MFKSFHTLLLRVLGIVLFLIPISCNKNINKNQVKTGASQTDSYFPLLRDKRVAVVANQTSVIGKTHLIDTLLNTGINIKLIYAPEHGFRGTGDAGEIIKNGIDKKTGLPVISLHGKHKKPLDSDLAIIDIVVFDIQDVGVRFYTYIATLQYVMEACAENNLPLIVLDRPNPNGFYVDGPVLDTSQRSFLGLNPIPLVHGLTIGEMAKMINGEKWLKSGIQCDLTIIKCLNYNHNSKYIPPVNPSPNLQNINAIYLYPTLGLFEGTVISTGRGTNHPFECYGHPKLRNNNFSYVPKSIQGASKYPKFKDIKCNGYMLGENEAKKIIMKKQINLKWIIDAYNDLSEQDIKFFTSTFSKHAGTKLLQKQIEDGLSESDIRKSWEKDLDNYKIVRKKYLLYPDFL